MSAWTEFEEFAEISWALRLCYTTVKLEVWSESTNRRKGHILQF